MNGRSACPHLTDGQTCGVCADLDALTEAACEMAHALRLRNEDYVYAAEIAVLKGVAARARDRRKANDDYARWHARHWRTRRERVEP